jgi:hypothetical protein
LGKPIEERVEFLPTTRLVQALDPQFEQSYYVASYVLARRGRVDEAISIAEDGIKNNPKSGLLRANLVQMLLIQDKVKNLPEMLRLAKIGIGSDMTFANADDEFEALGIFRTTFHLAGDQAMVNQLQLRQDALRAAGAGLGVDREGQ